jgi:hypothetical protein
MNRRGRPIGYLSVTPSPRDLQEPVTVKWFDEPLWQGRRCGTSFLTVPQQRNGDGPELVRELL